MAPAETPEKPSRLRLAAVILGGALFLALLAVLPIGGFGKVLIFGGLFLFGVLSLHYFIWGRWMERVMRKDAEAAERE